MSPKFDDNLAFQCAVELCFLGSQSANGLTEDILTKYRINQKRKHDAKHQSKL